uniref:TFIIS central domain-containing protein n=1 Tax=Salix viminalis TaxID=40686 RepID=A0A6N2NEZ8_SALVM
MSNNLASHQSLVQSIKLGQSEDISNKVNSSMQMGLMEPGTHDPALQQMPMSNMQMGQMGPISSSTDALSQQMSIPNIQVQLSEPVPNYHVLQNFSVSNIQTGQMEPRAYNMVPEKFLSNRQLGDMETVFHNTGLQQSSLLNKRKAPEEASSNNSFSRMLSMSHNQVAQMEHRPWLQPTLTPNKLPVQIQSILNMSGSNRPQAPSKRSASSKTGLQQSSVQKNQTGQMQPSSKANSGSDSVRSKLRQSLADALALVSLSHNKTSSSGKNPEDEDESVQMQKHKETQPMEQTSGAAGSHHLSEEPKESLSTKDNSFNQNHSDSHKTSLETSNTRGNAYATETSNNDGKELPSSNIFRDEDVSFSDSFFVKDELLQGNGLSWILEPDAEIAEKEIETSQTPHGQEHIDEDVGKQVVRDPQVLASEIEAELFKLFGGVNKKYKEKGRSLLFNLKDRNNPELREKVMSGEIPPGRFCSMTAEELASKELSEWRMAKAEELAQMVVLPDSDVDIRRLVKKTHKGEVQVEVEQDSVAMEVSTGLNSFTTRPKSDEKEGSLGSKPDQMKGKVNATDDKSNSEDKVASYTLMIPSSEGNDLMQGLMMEDELKDAEFLPPIVSLDEFMESLDSEPPFENLPEDAGKTSPTLDKDDSQVGSEAKSHVVATKDAVGSILEKPEKVEETSTSSEADGRYAAIHVESKTTPSTGASRGEHVWEGILQLSVSTMTSVIGIFKSGDKTSAKEWSGVVEVKGRVRLDAFEKFLQGLLMSRSRAVMVVHFVCKEGSTESERSTLRGVSDSYVSDDRVGFAEPARGVELYLCPSHSKTREMLIKVLPKDQLEIENGLIGVIVWRKAQVTPIISPAAASHHNLNSKKQHHLTSRRHHDKDTNMNVNIASKHPSPPPPRSGASACPNPQPDEDDDGDDVPPGFGPPAGRDEDDLPEFNFSSGSIASRSEFSNQNPTRRQGMASQSISPNPISYGQPKTDVLPVQPWNDDDDDDMPEWHPEETPKQRTHPLPVHVHGVKQPILSAHTVQQRVHQARAPLGRYPAMAQVNETRGQQNAAASWQQGTWAAPPPGPHGYPAYQSGGGQVYSPPGQQGMAWRRDAPRSSSGF